MSIIKSEDNKKWIHALSVIFSFLVGFLTKRFVDQLAIWFDLETKIPNIAFVSMVFGVVIGITLFFYIVKNTKTFSYLNEVYEELVRVVWPTKDATIKITIGLVVALVVVAGIFVSIDFMFKRILELVY